MTQPSTGKVLLVDFDGTLSPYSWPDTPGDPYPGAIEAMQRLHEAGFYLVIFTARAWHGWVPNYRRKQLKEVRDWLHQYKIPFDEISNEKRPSLYLIDDRAIVPGLFPSPRRRPPTKVQAWRSWWTNLAEHIINIREDTYGNQEKPDKTVEGTSEQATTKP